MVALKEFTLACTVVSEVMNWLKLPGYQDGKKAHTHPLYIQQQRKPFAPTIHGFTAIDIMASYFH